MVARLLLLLLGWVSIVANAQTSGAYIKLSLDSETVYFGDTVVLDVESTGLLDPLDLSPLTRHATLERETTGTRIAVVKGKVVEIAIRRMDLTPKQPGVLILGPITAGPVQSNSVHVTVLNSTRPTWQPQQNDLSINITASPGTPYVGQQVTLDVVLRHRYPINSENVTLPSLKAFSSREQKSQIRTTGKDDWFEVSWRYFIFPKSSGAVTLDPLIWSGNITRSHSERADFERRSEALTLNVQPAANDSWWLPAKQVTLNDVWSQTPTSLRAGDELERTIIVTAQNTMSGQIPAVTPPESRAILQSKLAEQRAETITETGVVSTAEFTFRVRAQSPIPVFLDTVRIPWWNTPLDQPAEAIIPARRINVGLPDRADLLAELALQESGTSRFKTWLKSTSWVRLLIYAMACVSLFYLLVTMARISFNYLKDRINKYRLKRELLALCDDPELLYRRLQPQSHSLPSPRLQSLIEYLHRHLFNRESGPANTASLKQQVQQLSSDDFTAPDDFTAAGGRRVSQSNTLNRSTGMLAKL